MVTRGHGHGMTCTGAESRGQIRYHGPTPRPANPPPTVLTLLKAFWDICLLRMGPEDLPASTFLLGLALAAHALSVVVISLAVYPFGTAVAAGVTGTALLAGLTLAALQIHGLTGRYVQTLTALAGTGTVLSLVAIVPNWWFYLARDAGQAWALPVMLLFLILVWSVIVTAHILRRALATPFFVGLVIAAVFYWVSAMVHESLFPVPH